MTDDPRSDGELALAAVSALDKDFRRLAEFANLSKQRLDNHAGRVESVEDEIAEINGTIVLMHKAMEILNERQNRLDGESRLQYGLLLNLNERWQKSITSVVGWMRTGATGEAISAIRSIKDRVRPPEGTPVDDGGKWHG